MSRIVQKEVDASNSNVKQITMKTLSNKEWYLIQVNSNAMFHEELNKIQNTWLWVFATCLLCTLGLSLSLSHSITKTNHGSDWQHGTSQQGGF